MSALNWLAVVSLSGLVMVAGSMVHIVPPDATPPPSTEPAPVEPPSSQPPSSQPQRTSAAAPAPAFTPRPVTLAEHPLLTVPVQGIQRSAIRDTWGESRANGARTHQATDIMAPGGTPVIAAAAGTVEKLYYSNGGGGITLYVRSPDRAWTYYYAHLQGYAPGLHEGQLVLEGELIGFVGDTGNAGTGNFHLHFGMSRMKPGERWWQGEPVNPYPLLAGTAPPR